MNIFFLSLEYSMAARSIPGYQQIQCPSIGLEMEDDQISGSDPVDQGWKTPAL